MIIEAKKKKQYYNNRFTSTAGNSKEIWKIINKILNHKPQINTNIDNLTINGLKLLSQIINNYISIFFSNKGSNLGSNTRFR